MDVSTCMMLPGYYFRKHVDGRTKTGTVAIYGLFSVVNGRCFYVGRTTDPIKRASSHLCGKCTGGRKKFKLRVLKIVSEHRARMEEGLAIDHYKGLGQANYNVRTNSMCRYRILSTKQIEKLARAFWSGKRKSVTLPSRMDVDMVMSILRVARYAGVPNSTVASKRNTIYAV